MANMNLTGARKLRILSFSILSASFLFVLSLLVYPTLTPASTHAEAGVDPVTTISISPSSTMNLDAVLGGFTSGTQTVSVSTNNYTGYTLSFTTNGTSTDLVNSSINTATIPTITLPEGEDTITSTDFTTASYGYSIDNTNYKPVPDTASEGDILATTTETDPQTNEYNLTFGVKTDIDTPAGTYNKTFTLTAVANTRGYIVTYDANVPAEELEYIEGMPEVNPQANVISGLEVTLSCDRPWREDYAFMGWARTADAIRAEYSACGILQLDPETNNETTLYAVWGEAVIANFHSSPSEFDDGEDFNLVTFENTCDTDSGYAVESESVFSKTPNYENDGTAEEEYDYENGYTQEDTVTVSGASRLIVELEHTLYGDYYLALLDTYGNQITLVRYDGMDRVVIPGDTVVFELDCEEEWGGGGAIAMEAKATNSSCASSSTEKSILKTTRGLDGPGYFGYYATIIPVYDEPHENGEETEFSTICSWKITDGSYKEPVSAPEEGKYFIGWQTANDSPIISKNEIMSFLMGEIEYADEDENYGTLDFYAVYRDPMGVTFDGNGLSFNDDSTKTSYTVNCGEECETQYGYKSDDYEISKTPNLEDDGTMANPYNKGLIYSDSVTIENEEDDAALMVEITKGIYPTSRLAVLTSMGAPIYIEGEVNLPFIDGHNYIVSESPTSVSLIAPSDTVTFCLFSADASGSSSGGGEVIKGGDIKSASKAAALIDLSSPSSMCGYFFDHYYGGSGGGAVSRSTSPQNSTVSRSVGTVTAGYGYYAKVSQLYLDEQEGTTQVSLGDTCFLNILNNGEYIQPDVPEGYEFLGWSNNPDDEEPIYSSDWNSLKYQLYNSYFLNGEDDFTLYAIWRSIPYKIVYDANGGNGEMPESTYYYYDYASGDTLNLQYASNFSKSGYGFAGFSFDQDAYAHMVDDNPDNNAEIYGPNETITIPEDFEDLADSSTHIAKLYAIWIPAEKDENNNPVYLQNWAGCGNLSDGEVIALTDVRDGNVYTIAKVKKTTGGPNYNKCWMAENLRLDIATANITADNTNNPAESFIQEAAELDAPFWDSCIDNDPACINHISYGLGNISGAGEASPDTDDQNVRWYSYGGMYSWYTATAGRGAHGVLDNGVANGDICPSGWSLPTGRNAASDFGELSAALGSAETYSSATDISNYWRKYPLNYVYSGEYDGTYAASRGSTGYFASSTINSPRYISNFTFTHDYYSYLSGTYGGSVGHAIRCLVASIYYVQYDANTDDAVNGTMPRQTIEQNVTTALQANAFSRSVSNNSGYRLVSWNTEADGSGISYADGEYVIDITDSGSTITLYAQWEPVTVMPVNFDGNGLSFADSSTINTAYYYNDCANKTVGTTPRYSHTPNLSEDGTKDLNYNEGNGAGNYANNYTQNEVITIPGASKLHITLTWGGEYYSSTNDRASLWFGAHPNYNPLNNYNAPEKVLLGNKTSNIYGGGDQRNSSNTVEGDVYGDTITIAFRSDSANVGYGYGYYAVVTALDANGDALNTNDTNYVCRRSIVSGAYKEPAVAYNQQFLGWSEDQSATTPEYTDTFSIINALPGANGETKTVYAIWRYLYIIHYDGNGGSGSIADQKIPVDTTAYLDYGYSFNRDGYSLAGWDEDPSVISPTYNKGGRFTAPASPGDTTLYAIWKPQLKIIYHDNYSDNSYSSSIFEQWITAGVSGKIASTSRFSRTGYKIVRWDTAPTGDGVSYLPDSDYTAPEETQVGDELHLYAIWGETYTVVYNANGGRCETSGNVTTSCMDNIKYINVAEGDTFNLLASNYNRSGYGFAGWSPISTATVGGSDPIYGPNETITAQPYSTYGTLINGVKTVTLYAVWVASSGDLQSFVCSSLENIGDVTALTDSRDGQVYAVAKLADGNCWMIENLRLEAAGSRGAENIAKAQGYRQGFIGLADAETSNFDNDTTAANSLYNSSMFANAYSGPRYPRYNNINTINRGAPSVNIQIGSNDNYAVYANLYSYGNYYTYAAAKANISALTYTESINSTNIGTSICPAGWHLPYGGNGNGTYGGGTSGGFSYLDTKLEGPDGSYGTGDSYSSGTSAAIAASRRWRSYPNNFVYSGGYSYSSCSATGTNGHYKTSLAASNDNYSYVFSLSYSALNPGTNTSYKSFGHSVRCVAMPSHTLIISYGTGVTGIIIDGVTYHNGETVSLAENTTHTIDMTLASGYVFDSWGVSGAGSSIASASTKSTTFTMGTADATLTATNNATHVLTILVGAGVSSVIVDDNEYHNNDTVTLKENATYNIHATFELGYGFGGWSVDSGTIASASSNYTTYTMGASDANLAIAAQLANAVQYEANGGRCEESGTITTDCMQGVVHNSVAQGDTFDLMASNFNRAGYGFAGWSTEQLDPDSATFADDLAAAKTSGLVYGPNQSIAINDIHIGKADNNRIIHLYAVWVASSGNIQNFSCSSLSSGEVTALTDTRDNQTYAVAKLADGNCWMIENLRLDPAGKTLDSANTNSPLSNFASSIQALQSSSFQVCTDGAQSCSDVYSVGLGNINGTTSSHDADSQTDRWYSYGAMYNWYTATAGHGTYSKTSTNGAMPGDICPAGWHLPYGGNSTSTKGGNTLGGYYYLGVKLNATSSSVSSSRKWRAFPNNFIYSGAYFDNETDLRGVGAYYRTATAWTNSAHSYYMGLTEALLSPGTDAYFKSDGIAVRCTMEVPTHNLSLSLGANVASIEVDGVTYSSNTTLSLAENSTHTINMTFASGYEFDNWSVSGTGASVGSTSTQSTTFTMGTTNATLTANAKASVVYMQNWTGCDSLAPNGTTTLVDSRDGTSYTVARLVDDINNPTYSRCWMTENLRLDFSNLQEDISASNTHNPSSSFMAEANATPRPAASNSGFDPDNYGNINYSTINIGGTDCPTGNCDIYGTYYDWPTATAGRGMEITSGDASGDICPAGWSLPTGTSSGDFGDLNNAINSGLTNTAAGFLASPANFVYSSGVGVATLDARDASGIYWSSTSASSKAYGLHITNVDIMAEKVSTSIAYNKTHGVSVRCIADSTSTQSNQQSNEPEATPGSQEPSQQNPEPQSAPQQSYQSSYSAPMQAQTMSQQTNSEENTKDETKEDSSEETNTQPLGVRRVNDEVVNTTTNTSSSGTTSVFGTIAIVGAGIAATTGLLLLAGKKREEDNEEEQ